MALNKSNNKTPSSRSGYLTEMSSSTGKKNNLLLPVRIKFTPSNTAPLSDGKKNFSKMMKPVLIKDLFPSTKKDRRNTIAASATTQKKRVSDAMSSQPYLNTQSCYKPKIEDEKSTFFNRKSIDNSKVRRQLYQSPSKSGHTSYKNINKNEQKKEKPTIDKSRERKKDVYSQNKDKESNLLPPNSIKNNYLRRSGSIFKPPSQQNVKRKTLIVNTNSRTTVNNSKTGKIKNSIRKSTYPEAEVSGINNFSSLENDEKESILTKDVSTMTSLSNLNEFERPSVIMSPFRIKSAYSKESSCLEAQNRNINKSSCQNADFTQANFSSQNPLTDLNNIHNLDINNLIQFKSFLDQSYRACESQAYNLRISLQVCESQSSIFKQTLFFVDNIIKNKSESEVTTKLDQVESDEKCDQNNITINIEDNLVSENISENNSNKESFVEENYESTERTDEQALSPKSKEIIEEIEFLLTKEEEQTEKFVVQSPKNEEKTESKVPTILISDENSLDDLEKKSVENLTKLVELSTIGEVSCESDDLNRYSRSSVENKENLESSVLKSISRKFSFTPKSQRRKSATSEKSDSPNRRRSVRLSAKRLSVDLISDSPKDDSFILLENELNVTHEIGPPQSKSMPASPAKPPLTPGTVRQWDRRVQRPLKEYMALKMNGTFLVTPDAKRFQSCLEPTDTPHSRKSLSRKIFMELCDLYAESPEHN